MAVTRLLVLATALVAFPAGSAHATGVTVQLRGSEASMRRQHEVAEDLDLTFLRTPAQVRDFVKQERLEEVTGNTDYTMAKVSFPYARAAVKTFIERLAAQYHAYSGEVLVVTSLTRPTSRQPRNASPLSVHPTGIAVDFRIPDSRRNRKWLETMLLSLERTGVLDATHERRPPHYHVAVFPERYEAYIARLEPLTSAPVVVEEQSDAPALSAAAVMPAESGGGVPVIPAGVVLLSLGAIGGVALGSRRRP